MTKVQSTAALKLGLCDYRFLVFDCLTNTLKYILWTCFPLGAYWYSKFRGYDDLENGLYGQT